MDTIRHTQDEQADMLSWHVDSVIKCGLAGTIFFSWTDEWYTGEQEITDWAFGLVTRDRQPKRALHLLRENSDRTMPFCRTVTSTKRHLFQSSFALLQWRSNVASVSRVTRKDRLSEV